MHRFFSYAHVKMAASTLSWHQHQRLEKAQKERFFVLQYTPQSEGANAMWKVSGSTQNVYTISLDASSGGIICDCPDFDTYTPKYGTVCKHVCFLLTRVGRLKPSDVGDFWTTHQLDESLTRALLERCQRLDGDVVNNDLSKLFEGMSSSLTNEKGAEEEPASRQSEADDDCPICYEALKAPLAVCGTCKNAAHQACLERWLQHHKTCVYCRAVWPVTKQKKYVSLWDFPAHPPHFI